MAEDIVIVVGEEEIVTWNLHGGDRAFNDSIPTTIPYRSLLSRDPDVPTYMSISPDLSRIVVAREFPLPRGCSLEVGDVSTGTCLTRIATANVLRPRFTQDGREVWAANGHSFGEQCEITEDSESGAVELRLRRTEGPSRELFWETSRGYRITDDWWVLSPTRKRLLWLPHHWRTKERNRMWSGRFLGLLHGELSEVVILEFLE